MNAANILDGLVLLALLGTMTVLWIAIGQLKTMRQTKADLQQLVKELKHATQKAESAVVGMKQNATEKGQELQELINKSQAMIDEMQIIYQSTNNLAERLTGGASKPMDTKAQEVKKLLSKSEQALADVLAQRQAATHAGK
jgi:uncharacterized membrane protein YcjF (UPF0283 family)